MALIITQSHDPYPVSGPGHSHHSHFKIWSLTHSLIFSHTLVTHRPLLWVQLLRRIRGCPRELPAARQLTGQRPASQPGAAPPCHRPMCCSC
jgi:hypothetical protein